MFGDDYFSVAWLFVIALLVMALLVPALWPVAIWAGIMAIFLLGAKPLEESAHSDGAVESTVGRGCAASWALLAMVALVASIFIIGALGS